MPQHKPVAIVFGASRGLGRAISVALAERGLIVGVACRRLEDAAHVSHDIVARGGHAIALQTDVGDYASVEAAVSNISKAGQLACVVNNAGMIEPIARIEDTDPSRWAALINVNVTGAYNGVRACLGNFKDGGAVVNISSGAASRPMEGWSAYCASKAALAMLTQSIDHEYRAKGISAYGFRPGLVDTEMQGAIRQSGINPVSQVEQSALLPPEVPARAVAWLCTVRPEDLRGQEVDIRDDAFQQRVTT